MDALELEFWGLTADSLGAETNYSVLGGMLGGVVTFLGFLALGGLPLLATKTLVHLMGSTAVVNMNIAYFLGKDYGMKNPSFKRVRLPILDREFQKFKANLNKK